MRALFGTIRRVAADYAAAHQTNLRAMIDEALLGTLALLVLSINAALLLAGVPA